MLIQVSWVVMLSGRVIDSSCVLKMLRFSNLATGCNNLEDLNPQHEQYGNLISQTYDTVHNLSFTYIVVVLVSVNYHNKDVSFTLLD